MMDLSKLSLDELLELTKEVRNEINFRRKKINAIEKELPDNREKHKFSFEATVSDNQKPYVAKMKVSGNKTDRLFYNFEKVYRGGKVTVFGNFQAKELDVIDYWHNFKLVQNGKLRDIKCENSAQKALIYKFVKKQVGLEDLLTLVDGLDENYEVLDELKD